jgi:exodeoxyribonuclease-1
MLAPMATLTVEAAERWAIDGDQIAEHARALVGSPGVAEKVRQVHTMGEPAAQTDPDLMIYSGGFIPDPDRREMARLRRLPPGELAQAGPSFQDPRLERMLFRYRARNWPETLDEGEREQWDALRLERLTDPAGGGSITLDGYQERIVELRRAHADDVDRLALLNELDAWADMVMDVAD